MCSWRSTCCEVAGTNTAVDRTIIQSVHVTYTYTPVDGGWATVSPLGSKKHAVALGWSEGTLGRQYSQALPGLGNDLGTGGRTGRLVEGRERSPPAAGGGK